MIARIIPCLRLPSRFSCLDYRIAADLDIAIGDILRIPFRGGQAIGVVAALVSTTDVPAGRLKVLETVTRVSAFDVDTLQTFLWTADSLHIPYAALAQSMIPDVPARVAHRDRLPHISTEHEYRQTVLRHRGENEADAHYVRWIQEHAARGKTLILAPDVLRAEHIASTCTAAGMTTALFHHQLNVGQSWRAWNALINSEASVLVTTKSGGLAPACGLQAIIVDGEDDDDHVQRDAYPYTDARLIVGKRALSAQIPILWASETPRFATVYRVHHEKGVVLAPTPSAPELIVVPIHKEPRPLAQKRLSGTLIDLARTSIQNGQSVLCFMNRAGQAGSLRCTDCGTVPKCPACDRVLAVRQERLMCVHCKKNEERPDTCPHCQGTTFEERAPGVPAVAVALEQYVQPVHSVTRDNADVHIPQPAIIVTTETIWKNARALLNRPFGLIVALEADNGLSIPRSTATEDTWRVLQRLSNLALHNNAPLVLQVWQDEHPLFPAIRSGEPQHLLKQDLSERAALGYPPFGELVRIFVPAEDAETAPTLLHTLLPSSEVFPDTSANMARRAVHGRTTYLVKYAGQLDGVRAFPNLPASWIIEPSPDV